MKTTQIALLLALAAVSLCGCGTVFNLVGKDPQAFGGVQKDLDFIDTPNHLGKAGIVVYADVPLCFVADTLTLPLVVYLIQHPRATHREYAPARMNDGPAPAPIPVDTGVSLGEPRRVDPGERGDAGQVKVVEPDSAKR